MTKYPMLGTKPEAVADYLDALKNEYVNDDIPSGLFYILGMVDYYELNPAEAIEFARLGLHILYQAGGRPVVPAEDGVHLWAYTDRYGTSEDAIVDNMIADWLASGRMPEWGEWALATPEIVAEKKPDWMA